MKTETYQLRGKHPNVFDLTLRLKADDRGFRLALYRVEIAKVRLVLSMKATTGWPLDIEFYGT